MGKRAFKGLALFVALTMLVMAIGGCAGPKESAQPTQAASAQPTQAASAQPLDQATTAAPTEEPPVKLEPEQIDVFSLPANQSGLYDQTWWGKLITDKTGAIINLLPGGGEEGSQKLQGMIAAGSLPDIVIFQDPNDVTAAIIANLLINLDEHLDKLPNVSQNAAGAMQYYRDNVSNGSGKLFALPNNVGPNDQGDAPDYAAYLRWDLYKQVGAPAINTMEDYLPALKKMQEAFPKTAEGKKVYGFTLWKDWDGIGMANATNFAPMYGKDVGDDLGAFPFLQSDYTTFENMNILDAKSEYVRTLHFYFQANQMGLLDPDSMTQTFDSAKAKATEGRVLYSSWNWFCDGFNTADNQNAEPPVGFMSVLPKDAKPILAGPFSVGEPWAFSIGAATAKLDTCLRYVDFMYSIDGLQELANGPQGVTWDLDGSGKPVFKEDAWKYVEDANLELPGGGTLSNGTSIINSSGLSGATINPKTQQPISYLLWDSSKAHMQANPTKLLQDWQAAYSAKTVNEWLKANNMVTLQPLAPTLAPLMPDEIDTTSTAIGDVVSTYSWQMVFAKDEAEFQKLYGEMVEKAKGLGLDQVYDWSVSAWKQAQETAKKYIK